MTKITGNYQGNGFFDLMPVFDERVVYNFEKDEFFPSANFDENELDFDAMYANPALQNDIKKYHERTRASR